MTNTSLNDLTDKLLKRMILNDAETIKELWIAFGETNRESLLKNI